MEKDEDNKSSSSEEDFSEQPQEETQPKPSTSVNPENITNENAAKAKVVSLQSEAPASPPEERRRSSLTRGLFERLRDRKRFTESDINFLEGSDHSESVEGQSKVPEKRRLSDVIFRRKGSLPHDEPSSSRERTDSLTRRIVDKVFKRSSIAESSDNKMEMLKIKSSRKEGSPTGSKTHQERLKSSDGDDASSPGTKLKRSEGSPVTFFPLVEVKEEEEGEEEEEEKEKEDHSPKPAAYNPFTSFQKRVSLSQPDEGGTSISTPSSADERRQSNLADLPRRLSNLKSGRKRSMSAADLTRQDIAICFFPEEPDWESEISEDSQSRRPTISGVISDSKSTQDWSKRERWESRLVYLVALVSYSISVANIYHFPALVYHYGGIPFLIPYTIFTIFLGFPIHFLECALGQYSQSGPVRVWDCAPVARGIGWSMFLLCLGVGYYYSMYAAYSIIYISRCFSINLPWKDCDEPADPLSNYSCVPRMCAHEDDYRYTPAEHYFFDHVLHVHYSDKILSNGLGTMVWTEVLGLLLAWIFVYTAIIQGVRSIGKVVFCLVILPYFVLLMLLSAGLLLRGSSRGLYMLFGTNFDRLYDIQVWRSAAEQVFFELGICQGIPLTYGSYCRHSNPIHIDSAIICLINYFTSILCAMVIFNILGALSLEMGVPVFNVLRSGPGIVFITYPEALSRVPGSQFWCFAFFLMLFSVAIGTQIAVMQTVMTVIYDEFQNAIPYRWLINLLFCCCLFLLGLVLCTSNGYYVVHLLNSMTGTMPRLPIAVCMVGTIVFIYGVTKFCEDMHFMIDYYPNMLLRFCYLVTPFLLIALTIPSWYLMKPLAIKGVEYTIDAIMVGWFTIWFILIWIILGAAYWIVYCFCTRQVKDVWRSLNSWGPRSYKARVSRTEFTSEDVANFTKSWTKWKV